MIAGLKPDAALFMTHFLDDTVIGEYRRLAQEAGANHDVILLYNREGQEFTPSFPSDIRAFIFDLSDIKALGYPRKGRRIGPADVELFVLAFHRAHPAYRRLWAVEYDVRFTAPWPLLFDAFADNDADLLGTTLHTYPVNPDWENWGSLVSPSPLPNTARLRGFFPIYRISAQALDRIDEAYKQGWDGHFECTLPTLCAQAGLKIEDIGGDGEFVPPQRINRFYTNTPGNNDLSPGSFVFRPNHDLPDLQPGLLYHPVKHSDTVTWMTGRRKLAQSIARRLARRVLPPLGCGP